MATTESSAVIRFINSVQAQPIFDSFHEPSANQVAQPGVGQPPTSPMAAVPPKPMAPAMPAKPITAPLPVPRVATPPLPDISFDDEPAAATAHGGETVIVGHPQKKRRWPVYVFAGLGLLALAGGVGYLIGNSGSGPQAPGVAAGAVPALAQDESETEAAAAVAHTDSEPAAPAVAETAPVETAVAGAPIVTDVVPEQTFDAGFDIIVEPAGARVSLDGKDLGPAPLRIGRLAAGAHIVDIAAPEGYESQRVELDLVSGEREVVRVSLDRVAGEPAVAETEVEPAPEPIASKSTSKRERKARSSKRSERRVAKKTAAKATTSAGKGTLMLGSKPPCKIYIDGKNTGLLTPQRALELSAGKHKVTLINAEHDIKVSTTVTIEAGKTKRLIKDMSSRL